MKFKINDIVNIKDGYGLKTDRDLNPWIITGVEINTEKYKTYEPSYKLSNRKKWRPPHFLNTHWNLMTIV